MRIEKDFLGEVNIPDDALYGIHSFRAAKNFSNDLEFSELWYKALGLVKFSVYKSTENFLDAVSSEDFASKIKFKIPSREVLEAMQEASLEVSEGLHFDSFIVPAISGGAGTSINMNVNEIITNIALEKLGVDLGRYDVIHPIEDANIFQSTNDVVPTALKTAFLLRLDDLEHSINRLRSVIERLEVENYDVLRVGFTQYQAAVPSTVGKFFSNYSSCLSRDWWRISKIRERFKVVNLGGSAIGTGLTVPRFVIFDATKNLNQISRLSLARGENLTDATSNLDAYVEVSGLLKALAVNLEKMSDDFRLLSAQLLGENKIFTIDGAQVGSSIMPGKVNPVISEFVISCVTKIYANDSLITSLSARGSLDLNPYLPVIGHSLLENLELLISSLDTLTENLFAKLHVNKDVAYRQAIYSPTIATALLPYLGYSKSTDVSLYMREHSCDIFEAVEKLSLFSSEKLKTILTPSSLLSLGFSVKDN
ncbi:MAG: aspartate ammonia-lyase [Spirochaetales bacterium]|nr:aspartate ammonia-lyase [Spirochaetales bacterium]